LDRQVRETAPWSLRRRSPWQLSTCKPIEINQLARNASSVAGEAPIVGVTISVVIARAGSRRERDAAEDFRKTRGLQKSRRSRPREGSSPPDCR
jgi:hypothetical protein